MMDNFQFSIFSFQLNSNFPILKSEIFRVLVIESLKIHWKLEIRNWKLLS